MGEELLFPFKNLKSSALPLGAPTESVKRGESPVSYTSSSTRARMDTQVDAPGVYAAVPSGALPIQAPCFTGWPTNTRYAQHDTYKDQTSSTCCFESNPIFPEDTQAACAFFHTFREAANRLQLHKNTHVGARTYFWSHSHKLTAHRLSSEPWSFNNLSSTIYLFIDHSILDRMYNVAVWRMFNPLPPSSSSPLQALRTRSLDLT